jgi:hypothetical protein
MVLEAFRYGDRQIIEAHPEYALAPIIVHFHARDKKLDKTEQWGILDNYRIPI